MDYILNRISKKIELNESLGRYQEVYTYYRVKIEYCLIFLLSYLWNNFFNKLDAEYKQQILIKLRKPSIGTIFEIIKILDMEKKIINRRLNKILEKYPTLRNDTIGHGYVFEDEIKNSILLYKDLSEKIINESDFLAKKIDIIFVHDKDEMTGNYSGIKFKSNGEELIPWACNSNIFEFKKGYLYGSFELNKYFTISPFIHYSLDDKFYLFRNLQEALTGRIQYNLIFSTGKVSKEWLELRNIDLDYDGRKKRSYNGTVINVFNKNFKSYIDIGVKSKIMNFLTQNKASVCATVWGHGGVGKTATVQSICDTLINGKKHFDYIVFLSAKDRFYNVYTGDIELIDSDSRIDTFESLIRNINTVLFNNDSSEIESIINFDGKVLIIIDDYETFPSVEKKKSKILFESLI